MLYLDCFSGAAGDMVLGALIDLGLPLDALKGALGGLAIDYGDVVADKVLRAGISATKFRLIEHESPGRASTSNATADDSPGDPQHAHHHGHHHLQQIVRAIRHSALSAEGQDRAVSLFERLAQAESAVHNTPIDRVHLHEVGAIDSIIDIVGAVYGFEWFGIDDIVASPLNVGGGTVRCAHGVFPVPAPATVRLLSGVPIYGNGTTELVTPTGALLITGFARQFGPLPAMSVSQVGYGAGDRDTQDVPNVLRILRGERTDASADERIVKLECEIDDMNPQLFGPLMDGLLAAGALDVFYTSVQMKKSRPGTLVTVIARPDRRPDLTDVLFRTSTTIGVRYEEMSRACLDRAVESIDTPYGPVRFKIARRDGEELNAAPEFDDCARIASERGLPIKVVQAVAIKARLDRVR